MSLVYRLPHAPRMLSQRYPRQIAIGQVVTLSAGFAARAFLGARQLFETAMKLFHLPTHPHGINDQLTRDMSGQMIGNDPFNVRRSWRPA